MKYPSAPRKSAVAPLSSDIKRRKTVSAPNANYDSDLDAHEVDGGGDLPKNVKFGIGDVEGGANVKAGGDASKEVGGGVNKRLGGGANRKVGGGVHKEVGGNANKLASAAGDNCSKVMRKLTYPSAQKGSGGGAEGKVGIVCE